MRNGADTASAIRAQPQRVLLAAVDHGDHELVTPEPGQQVARPQGAEQPLGHGDQQLVAGRVAQHVVDHLELVEVEEQADDQLSGALCATGEPEADVLDQHRSVGQPSQGVVVGEVVQALSRASLLGDVLQLAEEVRRLAGFLHQRHRLVHPPLGPVRALQTLLGLEGGPPAGDHVLKGGEHLRPDVGVGEGERAAADHLALVEPDQATVGPVGGDNPSVPVGLDDPDR